MAWQSWNKRHNPYNPFSEEEWEAGGQHVESGVMSSPYGPNGKAMRAYYDSLLEGFPHVCCGLPTTVYGDPARPHGYWCSKCKTYWRGEGGLLDQDAAALKSMLSKTRSQVKRIE